MISTRRRRWRFAAVITATVAGLLLAGCGSSATPGSPGNWTQAQKTTFAGLGYFGDGAAFTNCVRQGMETSMSVADATKAFNAIPSNATSKSQIISAISTAVGSPDGSSVANTFYKIATGCNKQFGASAPAAAPSPTVSPGAPGNWSASQKSQFLATAGTSGDAAMDACLAAAEEQSFTFSEAMTAAQAAPYSGNVTPASLTAAMETAFGTTQGDEVAQTLISQVTTCETQTRASAAPTPTTSAPAQTPTTSAPAAAPSPTASATIGVWTAAQRNQLAAAYDKDPNLSSLSVVCLEETITQNVPAIYALLYVDDIWVVPAPTYASVLPDLESKYGAEGYTIYMAWQAVTNSVNNC